MIDPSFVGSTSTPFTMEVERGRLLMFNRVVQTAEPVFTDPVAARQAGHPDLPVPPTFLFGLDLADPSDLLAGMGVDLSRVLHVEQGFVYHRTAYAGETLTFAPVITDIYSRQGGALEFVVRDTAVTGADGEPVADLHQVIAVRGAASDEEAGS
ncbi:MaoC family dehydratase N-terminal domain-containing protein [Streptomyces sp. NPDC029216]|uniref:MaoC family dehydratase N-terminal domain-containing protein n=1 Tax=Streptomyces sp. NPDC029216 TaxID=3154701 RepID=UPI0033D1542E